MSTSESPSAPLVAALEALWAGDHDYRMPETPEPAGIARKHNQFLDRMQTLRSETNRVTRDIGTEGLLGGQAEVAGLQGGWKEMVDNLNTMAGSLTAQIRDFAEVTTAIASGNFMRKPDADCQGEMQEWKLTLSVFVDQLNQFAHEVTRVARAAGNGEPGPQAEVSGASGTWKDLISTLNKMSSDIKSRPSESDPVLQP